MENGLKLKKFKVRVLVVPPNLEVVLFGRKPYYETREIQGYSLKDAKKRAGIK